MKRKQLISRTIEHFYTKASEETRLNKGMGVFEFERVKTLIEKYTSKETLKILDVGGGTGKYSEWLASKGHVVHMVEPVSKHLRIARTRADKSKHKFNIHQGESRQLNFSSNSFDLVILHGPLYHLQDIECRNATIEEAKRVAKQHGIILGFAINNTASTLVGLLNGLIHKKPFFEMCKEELITGKHNPPEEYPWLLAEAFYHTPEQLKEEFTHHGLASLGVFPVEGIAWLDKSFFASLSDPQKKNTLCSLIEMTERLDHLLPFSPHMMIAAQKTMNYVK